MPRRDHVLLACDIVSDPRRGRALDAVRDFGIDAQLSVHEYQFTAAERQEIWRRLGSLLDESEDRLLILDPRARIEALGTSRTTLEPSLHYIG